MKYIILAIVAIWGYGFGMTQCKAQTTIVMPDGTMMICTTYGTLVECTKV